MAMRFAVYDLTGTIADADLIAYAAAQQKQLREHVAPAYDGIGSDAEVRAVTDPADAKLADGEIAVYWHPNAPTDDTEAIAFHDRTDDGVPVVHGYDDLARASGDTYSAVLAHEMIEVLLDPDLNSCVELADGTIIDHEACDRVQAETYEVDGVTLSNFNTAIAFAPPKHLVPGLKYDHMGTSKGPNETRPGGYSQTFTPGHGWTMTTNMERPQSLYRTRLGELGLSRVARRTANAGAPLVAMRVMRLETAPEHDDHDEGDTK